MSGILVITPKLSNPKRGKPMTLQERTILFKIHEAVIKMTTAPLSTFTPQNGVVTPTPPYQPGSVPLPPLSNNQTQGYNPPVK